MASEAYYAHSRPDRPEAEWERLHHHLRRTAVLACRFTRAFGLESWGVAAGLLHDLGKYAPAFQRRLRQQGPRCDHSTAGAIEAQDRYGEMGLLLAYGIAGHHAGLPDGGSRQEADLAVRLQERTLLKQASAWQQDKHHLPLPAPAQLLGELERLLSRGQGNEASSAYRFAFLIRMVFSALVDADFIATERVMDPVGRAQARRHPLPGPAALAPILRDWLATRFAGADGPLAAHRAEILAACRQRAADPPGVFSLAVPTGAGKTLASLSFALEHAARHGHRRVIYAIPFTSIIDQTADVFRDALAAAGADVVLEHHSAADIPGNRQPEEGQGGEQIGPHRLHLATENWDAPLVVTTNVQLFESLHASRTSRCRKLHNLAGSVIVLDEVQALPTECLAPCLAALRELVLRYGVTLVLCSATLPNMQPPKSPAVWLPPATDIVPPSPARAAAFRRVVVERRETISDTALVADLMAVDQVLCIVDARRHAADLFRLLPKDGDRFHLSAAMCPAHRRAVLANIRARLAAGQPCRLIATRVIEAGVDISFPMVWRAMAGIDSIVQAAGRCNREGGATLGRFVLFESDRTDAVPASLVDLRRRREDAQAILSDPATDPLAPDSVAQFFQRHLSGKAGDDAECWQRLSKAKVHAIPFRTVAEKFRMIDADTATLLVGYGDGPALIAKLTEALERQRQGLQPTLPRDLLRQLQAYAVACYGLDRLAATGSVVALDPQKRFHAITTGYDLYDPDLGLAPERAGLMTAEGSMF